jgi:hypothetical protein
MCAYFRKPDNPCSQALALVLFKKDRYRGQLAYTIALVRARIVPTQWILV